MELLDHQLIAEVVELSHAGVGKNSEYLASVHGVSLYGAKKKRVRLFMIHLEKQDGAKPHGSRLRWRLVPRAGLSRWRTWS